jgi:hypothetical protein
MRDKIEVDLTTLERILHDRSGFVLHRLQGCIPEVTISPEAHAAILAFDFSRIDGVVGPFELSSAALTPE